MAEIELGSPIDGVLTVQHVDTGELVKQGEPVFEVEAMKVLHTVNALADGIVQYLVAMGEFVSINDVVALIITED